MSIPKRILGKTGYPVSEIGFGAWQIGSEWGEAVPEDQAVDALRAGVAAGMNVIDTADIYGGGRSESLIGRFLKGHRGGRIYVLTKMGRGPGWNDDVDSVRRAAEASCKRLGAPTLDLVQLHCIEPDTVKAGRVLESLETIKGEGLIQHYGLSVETIEHALWVIRNTNAATLQVIFNLFRQRLVDELFPAAREANVGIIARVPLASGVLAGKFKPGHVFRDDDHRKFNCDGQRFNVGETFAGVAFDQGIAFAEEIREILKEESPEAALAQKTMRWILDHEAVSTVIPGAKSAMQAQGNAATALLPALSPNAHAQLKALYREKIHHAVRGKY